MMNIATERLGKLFDLQRRWIEVDPLADYVQIGVRSFGNGLFHYEPKKGAELGRLRFLAIEPGDLVLSNIKAWEGAVAVASSQERGCIGSNRMLTYVPRDPNRVHTDYVRNFFLTDKGLALLGKASPGSADRNRTLGIQRLEALRIPLPDISEQRRLASIVSSSSQHVARARQLLERARNLVPATAESTVQTVLEEGVEKGWPLVPISSVAAVNPRPVRLPESEAVAFVPMAAVDDVTGTIQSPQMRVAGEVRGGYKQFKKGDVIFARITPCMQNGKSAVVEIQTTYGYGSTEFHVIRPREGVLPEWIHRVVRTHRFRQEAARRFTGTAGQQRVPKDFLERAEVPMPPSGAEQRDALGKIDEVLEIERRVRLLHAQQADRLAAVEVSVRNHAFNGHL